MGADATLLTTAITVEPGAEEIAGLQVRNAGRDLDEFSFEVVGPAAAWMTIDPAVLPLLPGAEGTVSIKVAPPACPPPLRATCPLASGSSRGTTLRARWSKRGR